ncbi:PTS fructose transporter subunit IIC [Geosporobacter ferrireducens]|uniref:PTS fructose transporter subunit IIC n=1 Tax=Geosporobacter ferrireducens TaxID=1424294 RepID=A0A1D8GHI3_9FIRM|nr:PTS fructose transporter subunit IIC [Geosporobacter ferrireducens]AOT70385.1 PTS fructose transporter subunit IIC [Geosporobacter ferrireducens]MTI57227.1 PTS fructose transporter subunit IIC [Geosporobacter ferrireducens]
MISVKKPGTSIWRTFSKHVMTGISYMIPILIMGGLIGAFSQMIPYVFLKIDASQSIVDAVNSGQFNGTSLSMLKLAYVMENFGFTLFGFAIPIFAAFAANSIGGRTALAAGFIGGYVANRPTALLTLDGGSWAAKAPVPSGFLGAIIIAFAVGYFVKWLNQKIELPQNWLAFKSTFLIPLLAALFCMVGMVFIVTPFGGWLNTLIRAGLQAAGNAGQIVYSIALAATTAFDLGGPVNKAAGFVALGFTTEKVLPITARCIAIVTPSFGLGLSVLIDKKLVGRRVYDKQFYEAGKTAIFLAFMGISEGSIPFALERPGFTIPLYVGGSVIGALTAVVLGAVQWFPESAIWAWPLVSNLGVYIVGLIVGAAFIAVINVLYRNKLIKEGKLEVMAD